MSLADIYRENFGDELEKDASMTKEAADAALDSAIDSLTEEEAEKLSAVIDVLEDEGLEFDHDLQKLSAAAEIVDEYDSCVMYDEEEKTAEEIDAGGRIFARAMMDELESMQ